MSVSFYNTSKKPNFYYCRSSRSISVFTTRYYIHFKCPEVSFFSLFKKIWDSQEKNDLALNFDSSREELVTI